MARWIRWTTKTGTSLWHRATPATALVHTRRIRVQGGWAIEKTEQLEPVTEKIEPREPAPSLIRATVTVYRRTACGFMSRPTSG